MTAINYKGALVKAPLPGLDDVEDENVPPGIPAVTDAHVHLFPKWLFEPIWQWFDAFGWPVRYKLSAEKIIEFLTGHGVERIVGLHYAHKPGVAGELNKYMLDICRRYPQVVGTATVYPGETGAGKILADAFESGLCGVKLHSHVQCFDMDSPAMHEIYAACLAGEKPLVMHVGREPKSPAYPCDPYELCGVEKVERVLKDYPGLKVCVPHLGADEFTQFRDLLEKYDNLWLDTTMVLCDYLPGIDPPSLDSFRADRIMFGTDFPNIPYAWDRELKVLAGTGLTDDFLAAVLHKNAAELFSITQG
jgi:predicted TIM-barrel fold metal-dependent hydrolase